MASVLGLDCAPRTLTKVFDMLWQVPMSLPSAERPTMRQRSQRSSPAAASQTTLSAHLTSIFPCLPTSSSSAAGILVNTSAFASVTWSNLFLLSTLCSATSRGTPDIAAQAMKYPYILKDKVMYTSGTSAAAPVRLFFPRSLQFGVALR
jgi:hypothetical protein